MKVYHVEDLNLPDLAPYKTLRRPLEHLKEGYFVAEGEKVVRRLLATDLQVISVLLTPEWFDQLLQRQQWRQEPPQIYIAEKKLLNEIVGFPLHQGIMAVARVPRELPWMEWVTSLSHPFLLVALDGVVSAENVGLIVRNCGAFGAQGIFVGSDSSSPYLRRAVRNSMGAVFRIPVFHFEHFTKCFENLKRYHELQIIAAHPGEKLNIYDSDLSGNICLVFGNEGWGISEPILGLCDRRVAIPMQNETDSLNVAAASAVFLYEARRQNPVQLRSKE